MKRNRKQLQVLFPAKTRDLSGTLVSLFYALAAFPPIINPINQPYQPFMMWLQIFCS